MENNSVVSSGSLLNRIVLSSKERLFNMQAKIYPANVENMQAIYVVGSVQAHFPSLSVEKEFFQAISTSLSSDLAGEFNVQDEVGLLQLNLAANLNANIYAVLSKPENIYIAREMRWSLTNIDNNEIYAIYPSSPRHLLGLITAIKSMSSDVKKVNIVIGHIKQRAGVNPNKPAVALTRIWSTSIGDIVNSVLALDASLNVDRLQDLVSEILSLNANDGATDQDRALNFTLYNNMQVYLRAYYFLYGTKENGPNPSGYQLVNVRTQWASSSVRKVVRIIFDFEGINTLAGQSWYSAVDITGLFPFTLTAYARYLQRN